MRLVVGPTCLGVAQPLQGVIGGLHSPALRSNHPRAAFESPSSHSNCPCLVQFIVASPHSPSLCWDHGRWHCCGIGLDHPPPLRHCIEPHSLSSCWVWSYLSSPLSPCWVTLIQLMCCVGCSWNICTICVVDVP